MNEDPVYTVGHSTHAVEAFVQLIARHGVTQVADVRTVPKSRRHPHFGSEALAAHLEKAGIRYRHFPALGGLRRPAPESVNTAWQHPSFRGYADHMAGNPFKAGLEELLNWSRAGRTAVMCAEALWWQCHRRLLADALAARNVSVVHILSNGGCEPHEITPFAKVSGSEVTYPGLL